MRGALAVAALLLVGGPAVARTVTVGQAGAATFGDAVHAAQDGDTIHLPPGTLYACGVLTQRNLVIEGEGEGSVLSDSMCEGKALLVARGDGLVVRNLVLARARVPDGNGAGIRLEGQGLTVDHVWFRNDEVGLLAGGNGAGAVRIRDCVFEGGGRPAPGPTAAVLVGRPEVLEIERTTFSGVKGAQVATSAGHTAILDSQIGVGTQPDAGAAVQAGGGALVMRGTTVSIGPYSPPRGAAIVVTAGFVEVRDTRLVNDSGSPATLLLNWTGADAVLGGNRVLPGDTEEGTGGVWRHRVGGAARAALGGARSAAGAAKRAVSRLFGG